LTQLLDATISSLPVAPVALSETKKLAIFNSVLSSYRQIVSAISTAIARSQDLKFVEAVDTHLNSIVAIIVELITEIVSTLKGVVSALESSK
jgi:hypothetical protein